jgi:hypothetical protein
VDVTETSQDDFIERVADALDELFGRVTVHQPPGYAHLPLAVVDSVFSLNARYSTCRRAVLAYGTQVEGRWPELAPVDVGLAQSVQRSHTLTEMLVLIEGRTGVDLAEALFAGVLQYTGGRRNADVVAEAAAALRSCGVETLADFAVAAQEARVRRAWRGVVGLGEASWAYLCLLAGLPRAKPDRMIKAFVQAAAGREDIGMTDLEATFVAAVGRRNARQGRTPVSVAAADHTVWRAVSGR